MRWRSALVAFSVVAVLVAPARAQLADEPSRREAVQFFRTGQEFMSAEKFDRAAEEFIKAIARDHLMTVAHYQLGQAYMGLQRFASAQQAYRKCIEASMELYDLQLKNKSAVERERTDMIREIEDTARRMRTATPPKELQAQQLEAQIGDLRRQQNTLQGAFQPPAEVLLALGSAFFRNGEPEAAEAQWKEAVASNPKLGQAHNNLAVIYMQTGRFDLADQEIKLAEKNGFRVNPQFKDDLKQRRAGK